MENVRSQKALQRELLKVQARVLEIQADILRVKAARMEDHPEVDPLLSDFAAEKLSESAGAVIDFGFLYGTYMAWATGRGIHGISHYRRSRLLWDFRRAGFEITEKGGHLYLSGFALVA